MRRLQNPILVYIGFAVFFAVGIFMLVLGFISVADGAKYVKTKGTVISVRTFENDEGDLLGVPTYEYYVDGVRYEVEGSFSQSVSICPLVGDEVTLRYNKNDPGKIKDDSILTAMFFVFGVVFTGVGGTMFVLTAIGKIHWASARGRRRRDDGFEDSEYREVEQEDENKVCDLNASPFEDEDLF